MKTEQLKMLAGELYDPMDPELVAARPGARPMPGPERDARSGTREAAANPARAVWGRWRERLDAAALLLRLWL